MEAQRRNTQILDGSGLLELGQNQADTVGVQRLNACHGARRKNCSSPLCAKLQIMGGL